MLLVRGTVRVYETAKGRREIVLYRVRDGRRSGRNRDSISRRLGELMGLVEQIAFQRLDLRLAYLFGQPRLPVVAGVMPFELRTFTSMPLLSSEVSNGIATWELR